MDIIEFLKDKKDENGKTFGEAARGWVQDFIDGNYDRNQPPREKTWCDVAVKSAMQNIIKERDEMILQSKP